MTLKQALSPHSGLQVNHSSTLNELRRRFLQVTEGRLERALQAMSNRQQRVVRLLPLLLHVNHPLFPGYVSANTPAGVDGFEPDLALLDDARLLHRSFIHRPGIFRLDIHPVWRHIQGVFLMGSLGTLAQSEHSDLDVWVCHDPELSAPQLAELEEKCSRLTQWAAEQGAEAHFFLVDPLRFASGVRCEQLTAENCGTSHHFLLLDEFYRTAIQLGGRTLLWWLVPAEEEHRYEEYSAQLQHQGLIKANDVLDLGHLGRIPPGEFLGAGLWQLYKAISSPYKAVLKLMLTEVYASQYPQVECLAQTFKQAVYANRLDLDGLDPYLLVYQRLEHYLLGRHELERLELVRRSLYHKVNRKLARLFSKSCTIWQYRLLQRLVDDWQWEPAQLDLLDARPQWKVAEVTQERRLLVTELTFSFRSLTRFARQHHIATALDSRDLAVLGRKLYAAFERKPGKIEFINPGISTNMSEEALTLVYSLDEHQTPLWTLHRGCLPPQQCQGFTRLKRARNLITLLAWCHRNGVIGRTTSFSLYAGDSGLTTSELTKLLATLRQVLPMPPPPVSEEALLAPSAPRKVLLLVNVGEEQEQLAEHCEVGRIPTLQENQVLSIEQLTLNTWNELMVSRYQGSQSPIACLRDYLQSQPPRSAPPHLEIRCYSQSQPLGVTRRLRELFLDAQAKLLVAPGARYLVRLYSHYHLLERRSENEEVVLHSLDSLDELLTCLTQPRPCWAPINLDKQALPGHILERILPLGRPEHIHVFYQLTGTEAALYILDEHNALWCHRMPFLNQQSLLNPLWRFLQMVQQRQTLARWPQGLPSEPVGRIVFYQIIPTPQNLLRLEWRSPPQALLDARFHAIRAQVISTKEGTQLVLTGYRRRFTQQEHGHNLYLHMALLLRARQSGSRSYPCYVVDIDLSALESHGPLQTVQYLNYKSQIEEALNEAMEQLHADL